MHYNFKYWLKMLKTFLETNKVVKKTLFKILMIKNDFVFGTKCFKERLKVRISNPKKVLWRSIVYSVLTQKMVLKN